MTTQEVEKIVCAATKECEKNFDKHKINEYTLANKTTIPFALRTLYSRKISDWGTDEDKDEIICYSEDGWEKFEITVQVGAGVQKIVSQHTSKLETQDVVKEFDEMNLLNQADFIHKAYSILQFSEYRIELL